MPFNPDRIRERRLKAAEGYILLDMPEHALRELDSITDYGAQIFYASFLRGEAQLVKKDHQKALDAFQKAHKANPADLDALLRMAWCFKRIDQIHQAIETMKIAYKSHKTVPLVLYNMACYYALAGEKEKALSWLALSLRMDRKFLNKIGEETDFDSLRNDPEFQHLLELTSQQNT